MTLRMLVERNLEYFWRVNVAVVIGVGVAVAVLAGALLVGSSVRGSLRDLALGRLGNVDTFVSAPTFFREALATELAAVPEVADAVGGSVGLLALDGFATDPESGRRAFDVQVFGVDDRFWAFHRRPVDDRSLGDDEAFISEELARELDVAAGAALLVRVERPTEVPLGSLHGRRDDVGRTVRLVVRSVLSRTQLGEFSLRQRQGPARTVFVSLARLQRDLGHQDQVNMILLGVDGRIPGEPARRVEIVQQALRDVATLDDLGLTLRPLADRGVLVLESESGLVGDAAAEAAVSAAEAMGLETRPILTYLVNRLRLGPRVVPYSLLTAVDFPSFSRLSSSALRASGLWPEALEYPPILLNAWAAADLDARRGDIIEADYFVWEDEGRLVTRSTAFQLFGILPIAGDAADRNLAPEYDGITASDSLSDWDPPFPIDLSAIRPRDEEYWARYRTTPKGFIELGAGQRLWQSRYGKLTSLRLFPPEGGDLESLEDPYRQAMSDALDPLTAGVAVTPVRALALDASVGTTDFGEYFTYFSFFLVASALLLASLFFRLGVEQRVIEIGALQAFGFSPSKIRGVFWLEALVLAVAGSSLGTLGAIGYAELVMYGLRTWWVDAVGTTLLTLHVSPAPLVGGAAGGVLAAFGAIALTLRMLASASARSLLTGSASGAPMVSSATSAISKITTHIYTVGFSIVLAVAGLILLGGVLRQLVNPTAGFFGAGTLLLGALLGFTSAWLRRARSSTLTGAHGWPLVQLGFRNTTYRPGRSVLCIALIAFAAFIIVAVDAFRREGGGQTTDRRSGTGGFTLLADSRLPVAHDLSRPSGRDALNLSDLDASMLRDVTFAGFRVREGDDASCLNLYQPSDPRVMAVGPAFVEDGRFTFSASVADTPAEAANPWLLLEQDLPDGVVPAIADATSLTYALHLGVGDELTLDAESEQPIRLRIVGALADSVLQRELVITERHFRRIFPAEEGFRFFMLDVDPERAAEVSAVLENRLSDFGFDVTSSAERLAAFHRVENTYLATFQALGGLGLLLGTLGLGAILLRNVLERRRELALMRAVGYDARHLTLMVVAENAFLLFIGLAIGTVCALLAIAPAWLERGERLPLTSVGWLLAAIVMTGVATSLLATRAALRAPLLSALKTE